MSSLVVNAGSSIPSDPGVGLSMDASCVQTPEPIASVIIDNSCPTESVNEAVNMVRPLDD